jgi:hypothetical protein
MPGTLSIENLWAANKKISLVYLLNKRSQSPAIKKGRPGRTAFSKTSR